MSTLLRCAQQSIWLLRTGGASKRSRHYGTDLVPLMQAPAVFPRSVGKLRMQQTMAAASKNTTAAEPLSANMARSQNGMGTRPFAAAQTMKYPMKCTRQPHAAINLHPHRPPQHQMHAAILKLFAITSKRWDSCRTHLGANLCLSLRAS